MNDHLVRTAIEDLAGQVRMVDLAEPTLRRARWLRRRRSAAIIGAGAALIVAMSVVPSLLLDARSRDGVGVGLGEPGAATASPIPSGPAVAPNQGGSASPTLQLKDPEPAIAVGGGWIVGAATSRPTASDKQASVVFDRDRWSYVTVAYSEVIPAPSANLASVLDPETRRYGILDVGSQTVTWTSIRGEAAPSVPAWSADSRRLAVVHRDNGTGGFSVIVVDARDGSSTSIPLSDDHACADQCQLGWWDDDTLVVPHAALSNDTTGATYDGVRLVSVRTGHVEQRIDLPGSFGSADDWSTDHRYVALVMPGRQATPPCVIYDTVGEREIAGCAGPLATYWINATQWVDTSGNAVTVFDTTDATSRRMDLGPMFEGYDVLVLVRA